MHRTSLSCFIITVLAVVIRPLVYTNAWSLRRSTSSSLSRRKRRDSFPRNYRQLDHEDEQYESYIRIPNLRSTLWKKKSMPPPFRKGGSPAMICTEESSLLGNNSVVQQQQHQRVPSEEHNSPSTFRITESRRSSSKDSSLKQSNKRPIRNVQELRSAILDDGLELRQTKLIHEAATVDVENMLQHDVIQLLVERYKTGSVPGRRQDNATLALSMEGGGMRGAVSAGMAAAIASLGLCNAFDAIYGSSAGSVVGAYMVSRQMCVDVYTDVLPAAQSKFVCKKRMVVGLMTSALDLILRNVYSSSSTTTAFTTTTTNVGGGRRTTKTPGMNISFVLDGIMDEQHGLRPLDMDAFRENDSVQPLRIATSCVDKDGSLMMKCLGTKDFFDQVDPIRNQTVPAMIRQDKNRNGLFACLEAGMTVPGATGPPVMLTDGSNVTMPYFDAFCFEPLPYRSAVEDGATHVLVLRSRPECFQAKTTPGVYERGVAPLYFRSHGQENVAKFFERGGQQFIYLEDLLTLEEGRLRGLKDNSDGIHIPPTTILYGVEQDDHVKQLASNRDAWKKAHVLPITVPKGTPELPTIEQGQDKVLEAVRGGFAAAFDILAPAIGLEIDEALTGDRVSKLVFPKQTMESLDAILAEQVSVEGRSIDVVESEGNDGRSYGKRQAIRNLGRRLAKPFRRRIPSGTSDLRFVETDMERLERCHRQDAEALLDLLPGIQDGSLPPISKGLHYCRAIDTLL